MKKTQNLKITTFIVDVTPPVGHPISYGINNKVDSPIFIRGIVLDDDQNRIVMASSDFIYIWGKANQEMKQVIAENAKTVPENVFLHSVHQHDSVRIAVELNEIFKKYKGYKCVTKAYYREIKEKLGRAIAEAVTKMRNVKTLASAERRVAGLASNRRLKGKDGKIFAMRWSMSTKPEIKKEPVGTIDPIIRSIGFIGDNQKPLAILHFYASHPMTAYGRNMVSSDVPGVGLDYLKKYYNSGKDALNIYFNGCGGNVTFGKYSISPKEKSLELLGEKLGKALLANCKSLEEKPKGKISIKNVCFEFPLNPEINERILQKKISEAKSPNEALRPSCRLILKQNWEKWKKTGISRISLGPEIHILSMPGETVVEYQLYAQSLIPEKFLACAAYGNGTYHYLPTKAMYDEGGYEPGASICTPEIEEKLKKAIHESLEELI